MTYIIGALLVLALFSLAEGQVAKLPDPNPHDLPVTSQAVCRHIINSFGFFPCTTKECADSDYTDWKVFQDLQNKCRLNCRSSYGKVCTFGDVYAVAKSGVAIGFHCQCSGISPQAICEPRKAQIRAIVPANFKGKLSQTKAKHFCRAYCGSLRPGTPNNDHCQPLLSTSDTSNSTTTTASSIPTALKSKKKKLKKSPFLNYYCKCYGDISAGDGDGEIEGPEMLREP